MERKILNWLASGEVGTSSKTIAMKMVGVELKDGCHPLDPDDFNRCLLLIAAVPEIRPRLKEMADVSPQWNRLIGRWDEIEKTFISEAGLDWCRAFTAPETYELMKQCLRGKAA